MLAKILLQKVADKHHFAIGPSVVAMHRSVRTTLESMWKASQALNVSPNPLRSPSHTTHFEPESTLSYPDWLSKADDTFAGNYGDFSMRRTDTETIEALEHQLEEQARRHSSEKAAWEAERSKSGKEYNLMVNELNLVKSKHVFELGSLGTSHRQVVLDMIRFTRAPVASSSPRAVAACRTASRSLLSSLISNIHRLLSFGLDDDLTVYSDVNIAICTAFKRSLVSYPIAPVRLTFIE